MKVTLIALSVPDTNAIDVRSLSSFLKKAGHKASIIFLASGGHKTASGQIQYHAQVAKQIISLCRGYASKPSSYFLALTSSFIYG